MKNDLEERNYGVMRMFYLVFHASIRSGINEREAKEIAYQAISLRFNISEKRARNVISQALSSYSHRSEMIFWEDCKELKSLLERILNEKEGV